MSAVTLKFRLNYINRHYNIFIFSVDVFVDLDAITVDVKTAQTIENTRVLFLVFFFFENLCHRRSFPLQH